jgi:hypothetical protein
VDLKRPQLDGDGVEGDSEWLRHGQAGGWKAASVAAAPPEGIGASIGSLSCAPMAACTAIRASATPQ